MRRVGIRAQAAVQTGAPSDSSSQVTRATLGLREMILRGELRPGQRISEIPLSASSGMFSRAVALGIREIGAQKAWSKRSLTPVLQRMSSRLPISGTRLRLEESWKAPLPGWQLNVLENPSFLEPLRSQSRHGTIPGFGETRRFHSLP